MEQHARTWEESPNIAKWQRKQGVNRQYKRMILMQFSLSLGMEQIHISILGFYGPGAVHGILNRGSGLRPSGCTWQVASASLAGDVIQVWINSSPSNHCISHFKAQLAQLFFIQHLICTYWIRGILCGYAIRSGRHPSGSRRPGPTCGRWIPSGCLPDRLCGWGGCATFCELFNSYPRKIGFCFHYYSAVYDVC